MAKYALESLGIDAPVVMCGNQVLFFQQSQISGMAKLGGIVTSIGCDIEDVGRMEL